MLEIIMLVMGLYFFFRGKVTLRGHQLNGMPAHIAGGILMLPLPLTFLVGTVVAAVVQARGIALTEQQARSMGLAIEVVVVIACAIAFVSYINRVGISLTATDYSQEPITLSGLGKPGWCPCPHCGKPGIPRWRKLFMGRFSVVACKECGRPASVLQRHCLLASLPTLLGVVPVAIYIWANQQAIEQNVPSALTTMVVLLIAGMAVGMVTTVVLLMRWVPLVPR